MNIKVSAHCNCSETFNTFSLAPTYKVDVTVCLEHESKASSTRPKNATEDHRFIVKLMSSQSSVQFVQAMLIVKCNDSNGHVSLFLPRGFNDLTFHPDSLKVHVEQIQADNPVSAETNVEFYPRRSRYSLVSKLGYLSFLVFLFALISHLDPDVVTVENKYPFDAFLESMLAGNKENIALKLIAITLIISIFAAFVERILEVIVAALRKPSREILELEIKNAERKLKVNSKSLSAIDAMFFAETRLASFKSTTRFYTLNVGFLIGCVIAASADITLLHSIIKPEEPSNVLHFINTVFVGLLIAGGAEPLHKLIKVVTGLASRVYRTQ